MAEPQNELLFMRVKTFWQEYNKPQFLRCVMGLVRHCKELARRQASLEKSKREGELLR